MCEPSRYYIYTRHTGSRNATWAEFAQNPILLYLLAIMGVVCFTNRTLLYEFALDMLGWW